MVAIEYTLKVNTLKVNTLEEEAEYIVTITEVLAINILIDI